MKFLSMRKIPDEDRGTQFHSLSYRASDYVEFRDWCQSNCRGEWGYEETPSYGVFDDSPMWYAWLYDDQDAMMFKLTFS